MTSLHYYNEVDLTESESRWLYIFKKKSFIAVLIGLLPGFLLFKIITGLIGVFALFVLEAILYFVTSFPMPSHWTLNGAGLTIDILLMRRMVRMRNRKLYVRLQDDPEEVENS